MLSDFLAEKFLDVLLSKSTWSKKPTTLYFALFKTTPADDGTGGTEITGSGYARVPVAVHVDSWNIAGGEAKNAAPLVWPSATADWGTVLSIGIYTAATGGTFLAAIPLAAGVDIDQFNQFRVETEGLTLWLDGSFSTYAANILLSYWLEGTALPNIPTIWAGLCTGLNAAGLPDGEPMVWSYERKGITNNTGNFPAAASRAKTINNTHTFISTPNAWPQVTNLLLSDGFLGHRVTSLAASNFIVVTANQFQNTERVVFVRHDLGTATIDASVMWPNRVFFVRDRATTQFKIAATSGGAAVAVASVAIGQTTTAPTAYACDAASITCASTNGSSDIASTAHGLVVGDMLALCPLDFGSPGSTTYPTTIALNTSPTAAQHLLFVVDATDNTFKVSTTKGGAALSAGSSQNFAVTRINQGRALICGPLTSALNLLAGDTAQIPDDSLTISLD